MAVVRDASTSPAQGPSEELSEAQHPIRIAVVGCGYWGPNVIRNFSELPECSLRIVCDEDPDQLERVARRYPAVVAIDDFGELLCDPQIDAIAICTPVHTHYPLARAALEAGKHVLLEKPLTHSLETSQALVDLANAKGLTLMVDHTFVFSGAVQKIRSIIDSGEIGEILYFDSVRINLGLFQHDINVIWDLAPHDLSIMDYLIGREPVWVSAIGTTHFGKLENLAYLTMKFDGALIGHVHVNWLAPVKLRSTVIGGSKRMIVYDDLEPRGKVMIYDKGVTFNGDRDQRNKALVDYRTGDMYSPCIDTTEPLRRMCRDFAKSVRNGTAPLTDGEAGCRVVRILEAAQTSITRNGERITL